LEIDDLTVPQSLIDLQQQLTAAPAAAEGETPVAENPPAPSEDALQVDRPRVDPELWVRVVWTLEDHLPMFAEPMVAADAQPPSQSGVALPNLDDNIGRLAIGLNELSWVVSEQSGSSVVFIFHDLMADAGDLWTQVAHASTLPVFALHVDPKALVEAQSCFCMAEDAAPLAMQYLDAVRACLPAGGGDCICVGLSAKTAWLAQEVATQLALRSSEHTRHAVRSAIAVRMRCPSDTTAISTGQPLASAAYQVLYAAAVASANDEPPTWSMVVGCFAACTCLVEQLEILADGRPPSTPRSIWDAEIERDVREAIALFALAAERLPWPIASAHLVMLDNDNVTMTAAATPRLRRASSFARLMHAGRQLFRVATP
jgi:hypothetical protein